MKNELSKLWGIVFLGVWIVCIPLLAIPRVYINVLVFASGALVAVLGFLLARGIAYHISHIDHDEHSSR